MLIQYSRNLSDQFKGIAGDWRVNAVRFAAKLAKAPVDLKWARTGADGIERVRFALPEASNKAHDDFVNAIFSIDPWAKIRTARANYEDCEDYLLQKAARE